MYRIELAPGEETVFRTFEELATGVRNGFITSRARIFHAASQKWLPIEFHPHYKQALENPARGAPTPAVKSAERARGGNAGFAPAPGLFGSVATGANAPASGASTTSDTSASSTTAPDASTTDPTTRGPAEPSASPQAAASSAPVSLVPVTSEPAPAEPGSAERASDEPSALPRPAAELMGTGSHSAALVSPTAGPASAAHLPFLLPQQVAVALLSASVVETATAEAPAPEASLTLSHAAAAPTATEDASVEEPVFLQLAAASPVLELPKITYPEITPTEEPVARRRRASGGSRRALVLAGVAIVLVAGGYAALSVFSSPRGDSTPLSAVTMADRPAMPSPAPKNPAAAPRRAEGRVSAPVPASVTSSVPTSTPAAAPPPAQLNPSLPASSGFAPALEPRAIVSTAPVKTPTDQPDSSSLAPAPIVPDLAVPALPRADSLAATPGQHADSAMKRILRAVSGKETPQQH